MASRVVVVGRFGSQLPVRYPALREQVKTLAPARAFAGAAGKAQDDAVVEVQNKENAPAVSAAGKNRAWPKNIFPSLLSPLFQPTSLTQMMDTVERLFDMPLLSPPVLRNANHIPWDVMEDDKSFKMRVDLPGMSKEDVKLSVEDGELVLQAEHNAENKEDDWAARSYGIYHMRIKLPANVDFNNIKAEMKDGVLKVVVPKVEGAKQKQEVRIE